MKKQVECTQCGSKYHYQTFCPSKPKKTPPRSRVSPSKPIKRKKPTASQIKAKEKRGEYLTVADKKILYKNQKEKAWKAFSDWVRKSECLASTGTFERGICVTCNVAGRPDEFPYSKLQAGHAVGTRGNAVLFREEIVHIQCSNCNRQGAGGLAGDYGNYMAYLVRKYGLEHAESLQRLKNTYKEITYDDLVEIEQKYKLKLKELKCSDRRVTLI